MAESLDKDDAGIVIDGFVLVDDTLETEVEAETYDGNKQFLCSPNEREDTEGDIIYEDEGEPHEETEIQDQQEFFEEDNDSEFYVLDQYDELLHNNEIEQVEDNENDEKLAHTLYLRRNSRDSTEYYYCEQCQLDYNSIEEFSRCHAQEEARLLMPDDEVIEEKFDIVNSENVQITDLKPDVSDLLKSARNGEKEYTDVQYNEIIIKQEESSNVDDTDKFFCYECHMVFNDYQTAEDHECSSQPIVSETNDDYVSLKDKPDYYYECTYCQSRLKTFGGLQRHQLNCRMKPATMQPPPDEFKCKTCLKLLPSAKALTSHERHHELPNKDSNDEIKCSICNTVFKSSKNLKLHQKIHDKKPTKSIQDALPFGAALQYNESNKFYCEICNKNFDQNLLAVHKNMHQNIEEFNCRICNKQFENMPSYEMHMQLHAERKQKPRAQTVAERSGTKLPFPCQYCGREFARPHEKVKHERIHTGEKPYECEVCGKTFRVSYSLTLHLRSHTDIRPYVCATCNKRFKSQPVYAHHLNTHLVERPYKCDICPKSFRTSVQLCGHKNSHSKPFNCTECNRPFATLYAVKVHMKTHCKSNKSSENLKHRCTVCGAVYARIFALRFHMREQHSMELGDDIAEFEVNNDRSDASAAGAVSSVDLDDEDAALLIAAASEASNNAIATENNYIENQTCYTEDEISTQAILQSEEIIVDNFHTEEVVTDW